MSRILANSVMTASHIREKNARTVLRLMRDLQPISRLHLAKHSRMSIATVTRIVSDLLENGIVQEIGPADTERGRKPVLLKINEQGRLVVGVRLDTRTTLIGLVDLAGNVLAKEEIETQSENGPRLTFQRIKAVIDRLLDQRHARPEKVLGYGFTLPGLVRKESSFVDVSVALGWEPCSFKPILQEVFGKDKVSIDGLSETLAQEEYYFGWPELRQPGNSVMFMFVGEGVSAILMIDGKLFRGHSGDSGDIGHIPALQGGPLCRCGNRGCLEALVSKPAILARLRALTDYLNGGQGGGGQRESELLAELLQGKMADPRLAALAGDIAGELAWGILVGINCYDPATVVVGGEVFQAGGQALIDAVRSHLNKWLLHEQRRRVVILPARLNANAGIVGAASLVYHDFLGVSAPTS